jgi:hypothetical protein
MRIKNFRKIRSLYFLALFVGGCATQAQIQLQQMQQQTDEVDIRANACFQQARASDVGQRLLQILVGDESDTPALQKALINRVASEREKNDLIDFRTMQQPCRTQIIEGFSKVHPLLVNVWAKIFAENDEMVLKILKGEITIGDANAWSLKMSPLRLQAFTEVSMQINQELRNAHAFELQQRAAAALSLQQWAYQEQLLQQHQQVINSLNRPTYTNCRFIGNNVNCTSY